MWCRSQGDERELLRLAAAAEQGSEHPLGQAVVREAAARGVTLPEVTGFPGRARQGVVARSRGRRSAWVAGG